jgi:hypothetical protein
MFIQQPVSVVARPVVQQEVGVDLGSLLTLHYLGRFSYLS